MQLNTNSPGSVTEVSQISVFIKVHVDSTHVFPFIKGSLRTVKKKCFSFKDHEFQEEILRFSSFPGSTAEVIQYLFKVHEGVSAVLMFSFQLSMAKKVTEKYLS